MQQSLASSCGGRVRPLLSCCTGQGRLFLVASPQPGYPWTGVTTPQTQSVRLPEANGNGAGLSSLQLPGHRLE